MSGPDAVFEAMEKYKLIQERLKIAQSLHKSYADVRKRALVFDIPGTTRDFLDVYVNVNGVNLRLIDTAGIHHTEDYLENLGVNIAKKFINESELILLLLDVNNILEPEDIILLNMTKNKNRIIVGSKSDLPIKMKLSQSLYTHNVKQSQNDSKISSNSHTFPSRVARVVTPLS
ncbi:MAG: GTP-binding protein, partial [Candidatus Phytoplasma australasiaticum]|nr:GTP-binding protein [Candidatus Phytoplasma australasiaticum]